MPISVKDFPHKRCSDAFALIVGEDEKILDENDRFPVADGTENAEQLFSFICRKDEQRFSEPAFKRSNIIGIRRPTDGCVKRCYLFCVKRFVFPYF